MSMRPARMRPARDWKVQDSASTTFLQAPQPAVCAPSAAPVGPVDIRFRPLRPLVRPEGGGCSRCETRTHSSATPARAKAQEQAPQAPKKSLPCIHRCGVTIPSCQYEGVDGCHPPQAPPLPRPGQAAPPPLLLADPPDATHRGGAAAQARNPSPRHPRCCRS